MTGGHRWEEEKAGEDADEDGNDGDNDSCSDAFQSGDEVEAMKYPWRD